MASFENGKRCLYNNVIFNEYGNQYILECLGDDEGGVPMIYLKRRDNNVYYCKIYY